MLALPTAMTSFSCHPIESLRLPFRASAALLLGFLCLPALQAGEAPEPKSLRDGVQAFYRGDYAEAAAIGQQRAKAQPAAAAPRVLIARARIAEGNTKAAFEELERALRVEPQNFEALHLLGSLAVVLSQNEYQKLFAIAPDSARVHQLMADSFRAQENLVKAEEEYHAAIKADPNLLEVLNILGDMKRYQFKFEEAKVYYSRAIAVNERDYDSRYGMGACHLYLQAPEAAVPELQRAIAIDPKAGAAHLALGDALLRTERPADAASSLRAAIAIEPKMRQAYSLLGRALQKMGRTQEAKEAFRTSQVLIQEELEGQRSLRQRSTETMVLPPERKAEPESPQGTP